MKGAKGVAFYHKGLISQAINDLFPDINFDISKFRTRSNYPSFSLFIIIINNYFYCFCLKGPWDDPVKRRQFFEDYAKKNHFDSLNADNWYCKPTRRSMERMV